MRKLEGGRRALGGLRPGGQVIPPAPHDLLSLLSQNLLAVEPKVS